MQKIVTLFQRNYDGDRLVRDEVVPGAEWVIAGEGIATRKFDGTCCLVRDGKLYKRYDLKAKKGRHTPPPNWEPAQAEADPVTTSWPGWLPVGEGPEDAYFREAFARGRSDGVDGVDERFVDGQTYELCGPKVQGNPEQAGSHVLVKHGSVVLDDAPRDFESIKSYLAGCDIEGIVWHHLDGRMVKIKKKDFGFKR